jgi:hypothetical protein
LGRVIVAVIGIPVTIGFTVKYVIHPNPKENIVKERKFFSIIYLVGDLIDYPYNSPPSMRGTNEGTGEHSNVYSRCHATEESCKPKHSNRKVIRRIRSTVVPPHHLEYFMGCLIIDIFKIILKNKCLEEARFRMLSRLFSVLLRTFGS